MHAGMVRAAVAFATCALWMVAALGAAPGAQAQDRRTGSAAARIPLAGHYDQAELERATSLGGGSLRGVMGVSNHGGAGGLLGRVIRGRELALAEGEWVFLLPMTAHVQDWYDRNNGDADVAATEAEVRLHRDAWKYAGRCRTDADGNFAFDGLRPGRYVVLANFTVPFRGHRAYHTGEYLSQYIAGPGTGHYITRPVTRVDRYDTSIGVRIGEVVEIREGEVTTFSPPSRALY